MMKNQFTFHSFESPQQEQRIMEAIDAYQSGRPDSRNLRIQKREINIKWRQRSDRAHKKNEARLDKLRSESEESE